MLERQEPPGPADARLHLVADQQGSRLVTAPLRSGEIAIRRELNALALDRLDDQRGDVAAPELAFERFKLAERDRLAIRQQRSKARAELVDCR